MTLPLSEFRFLNLLERQQCQSIEDEITALQGSWKRLINDELPAFTLGASIYRDAAQSFSHYQDQARQLNPLLLQHFSGLYEHLARELGRTLGAPVIYDERIALPGFHIFLAHEVFKQDVAKIHFDLPFLALHQLYPQQDPQRKLSFTLSLALPKQGGGLHYWDISYDPDMDFQVALDLAKQQPRHELEYEIGSLVYYQGLVLHRIASCPRLTPQDKRITLQGHGIFNDGQWIVYF